MKAASSELTLTIVAIIAIGLVLTLITTFLKTDAKDDLGSQWDKWINQEDTVE